MSAVEDWWKGLTVNPSKLPEAVVRVRRDNELSFIAFAGLVTVDEDGNAFVDAEVFVAPFIADEYPEFREQLKDKLIDSVRQTVRDKVKS